VLVCCATGISCWAGRSRRSLLARQR
jgi:hypothetical protein